jgi:hypothetical protein
MMTAEKKTAAQTALQTIIGQQIIDMMTEEQKMAARAEYQRIVGQAIVSALRIAKVKFTVNADSFKDVLSSPPGQNNTVAAMAMEDDHNRVRVEDPGAPAKPTLKIKPGGATIQFKILGGDDGRDEDAYVPIGIAFVRKGENTAEAGEDRLGELNFAQSKVFREGNCLYVTDEFKDVEADDRYEFSVIIQDTKTGAIGIIDPPIEHEPEDQS